MHSFFRLSLGIAALSLALVLSGCLASIAVETNSGSINAQVANGETLYDGVPASRLRAFVTSATYAGKLLRGVGGANAFCNARAVAAGLSGRKYAALIRHSTGVGYSGISMNKPLSLYNSVTDRETVLADSLTAVFGGQSLTEAISLTEGSVTVSGSSIPVWTGMTISGTTDTNTCANWNGTGTGRFGDAAQKGASFFSSGNSTDCDATYRLICIGEVGATVNYAAETSGVGGIGGVGGSPGGHASAPSVLD